MKAHVILEFTNVQSYQQTMWDIFNSIPQLVDWEEVEIYDEKENEYGSQSKT